MFFSKKIQKNNLIQNRKEGGMILSGVLVFAVVAIIIITGVTSWFGIVLKSNRNLIARERAFHLAESGVEYYRWHLAHDKNDFQDGTGEEGPYVHEVFDKNENLVGSFTLNIVPPTGGSTSVIVESTGQVEGISDIDRKIKSVLAIPSFGKFAFVANSDMRFGEGTTVYGPIHSNGGIRFDGLAHNVVSSALATYNDPDHSGDNEFGVHTHVSPTDPLPPSSVPERPDIFLAGREFPKSAVDFVGITSDVAQYKNLAQEDGLYFSNSGRSGYLVILKTDDSFDLYQVRSLIDVPSASCTNSANQTGWGTWSVGNSGDSLSFIDNYDFPQNGILFFEDNIWVEGQIDGARLNIVAATFPDLISTRRNITVNNDLLYSNYDGTDVIGLIAQNNINVGLYSLEDLQIDAALIAQNGRIGRYYYRNNGSYGAGCSPYAARNELTLNGMIGTMNRYGFAYTDNTGYQVRNINYDANLLYNPPPSFPLTSDYYEILTWEEVEN